MKQVSCEQLGIKGCPFTALGKDTMETTKKLHEHAREAHDELLANMSEADAEKMNDRILEIMAAQPDEPKKEESAGKRETGSPTPQSQEPSQIPQE